jgi:glutathione S-transferase
MKLYTHPLSSNARRVRLVVHQLGLQLDEELVDLATGAQRTPEYLALNPMGKVPTLVDGDVQLTESYAIMIYLCEKTGRRELYPDELATRTEINRWMFWGANEWSPIIARLNFENMLKPMLGLGSPDPARVQEAENAFKQLAAVLDTKLKSRQYVSGNQLSLADFALSASLATAVPAKLPLAGFSQVQAWQGRIEQLPAWKATAAAPPKPTR